MYALILIPCQQSSTAYCSKYDPDLIFHFLTIILQYAAGEFAADGAHMVQADGDGEPGSSHTGSGSSTNAKSKSMAKMVMGDEKFELVRIHFDFDASYGV
jgi:hypothetical protein